MSRQRKESYPIARFQPTARSRVRRLPTRASYDVATVRRILDAGLVCHVGYLIDGEPYVTPTTYWREGNHLYWHGSRASRMLEAVANGTRVCVTVTHLDGLVAARSGFHHSINYRSVMLFGRPRRIDDPDRKRAALDAFVDRLYPTRVHDIRPPTPRELKATSVVVMTIDEASAKIRSGSPLDDEEDYALPVWAGVIPVETRFATPIADARLPRNTPLPAYLTRLVRNGLDATHAATRRRRR
jgi:nitroimidazol reductase NimA-like FMN-containing flavoprotein (pyridoxamine 5'-phosphate oxidase superfamily)